jgi:hypothetical protein
LLEGLIYQFVYNLDQHRLLNIRLRYWLFLLCIILPLTAWLKVWEASRLTAAFLTLGALCVNSAIWWAARQRFVRFVERSSNHASVDAAQEEGANEPSNQQATDQPLPAMSQVRVCATGLFEVSGKTHYFVETPADYTTFETREHCLMAHVTTSRFLLVGASSANAVGWWYSFFQPAMIRSVASGWLHFGLHPRPALRLEVTSSDDRKEKIFHLSFDNEAARSLILADLCYDADLD